MSETQEQAPVEQTQQPVAAPGPDYSAQVELLKAKNQELLDEKRKVKSTVEDLQKQLLQLTNERAESKQRKLEESGQFQDLWKQAQEANATLKNQIAEMQAALDAKDQRFTQEQIKANALNTFAQAGAINPEQMYALVRDQLRFEEEALTAVDGGVSVSLGDFVDKLRQPESGWEHHFRGNGSVGMGSGGANSAGAGGMTNPYLSGNFAEIVRLETDNPELAKRMQQQAKRK